MSDPVLDRRRVDLEEAFFARQNEEVRRRIIEGGIQSDRRAALAAASHVRDPAVLDRLLALGLGAGTLSALTLVPLVLVAWADGELSDLERDAVMKAAEQEGLPPDGPSHRLLEAWLRSRPGPELAQAWEAYVRALTKPLELDERRELEQQVMFQATRVADAAGGFLGLISRISVAEREMLSKLSAAFHP